MRKHSFYRLPLRAAVTVLLMLFFLVPCAAAQARAVPCDSLTPQGTLVDDGNAARWRGASNIAAVGAAQENGAMFLRAIAVGSPNGEDYTVMRLYAGGEEPNLLEYDTISVPVLIPETEEERVYPVRLTLYSGAEVMTAETEIPGGAWYTVSADIGEWNLRTVIHMIEITVTDGTNTLTSFSVGPVTAGGEADLETVKRYMAFGFTAEGGTVSPSSDGCILEAGTDGVMTLAADAARPDYRAGGGVCVLRVVLANAVEGGSISLSVSDAALSAGAFTIASSSPIYYGENTYLLPYDASIPLHAYRLSFRGLYEDGPGGVRLTSVSAEAFDETTDASLARSAVCAVSDDGKTLTVTGSIASDTVAQYIHGQLELYEIPVWMPESEALAAKPLASMKISTKFSFTADLTGRAAAASVSRYAVYLRTDGALLPVVHAQFPAHNTRASERRLSVVGLYGAETSGVFASNASSVICDVEIDRLLGGAQENTNGRLCARGGRYYYLDYAYLNALDEEIGFYVAADVEVYLRLLCREDLSGEGYTFSGSGPYYAFNVWNEEGANMLCAVTEYLAARYRSVCGFIVGQRLNMLDCGGDGITSLADYASLCADTMRLVYNSAVTQISDIFVVAPFGHEEDEAQQRWDSVLLAVQLSRRIRQSGDFPWGLLYLSDYAAEALGRARSCIAQMKAIGCPTPHDFMTLWQPDADYAAGILLEEYAQRCLEAQKAGARVLFLSVLGQSGAKELYDGLKYTLSGEGQTRQLSEFSAAADPVLGQDCGKVILADYSRSYSTLGWMAGSGCERLGTQANDIASGIRSLHAVFRAPDGELFSPVSGNILCVNGHTDNFAHAPLICFRLRLTTELEGTERARLTFVFGSGDTRAEYTADAETGRELILLCDLSGFAGAEAVNFTAIAVQSASAVTLDIYDVTAYSETYSDEDLAALYQYREVGHAAAKESGERSFTPAQTAGAAVLLMASILSVALLSRHENREERAART